MDFRKEIAFCRPDRSEYSIKTSENTGSRKFELGGLRFVLSSSSRVHSGRASRPFLSLTTYRFWGYPPAQTDDIPTQLIEWLATQLGADPSLFSGAYGWKQRVWWRHLAWTRERSGTVSSIPRNIKTFLLLGCSIMETICLPGLNG